MKIEELNGDHFLSPHLRNLWSIHQDIIFKWSTYTIFKYDRGIVLPSGQKTNSLLMWYVPRTAPDCFEICEWLEYELEKFIEEPEEIETKRGIEYYPGADVDIKVVEFSAIEPYLDRDTYEAFLRTESGTIKKQLEQYVEKMKKNKKEKED
jgi:hypothetical protein